jgi:hypothetical protein
LAISGSAQAATGAKLRRSAARNDGMTHQRARFVQDNNAPFSLTGMNIRVIWRRDRCLRGSNHMSFQQHGYPAARLTEPRENFAHEYRTSGSIMARSSVT